MNVEWADKESFEIGTEVTIAGSITKFLDDRPGRVLVEINGNVLAELSLYETATVDTVKARTFDSALFVGRVLQTVPQLRIDCNKAIFQKRSELSDA